MKYLFNKDFDDLQDLVYEWLNASRPVNSNEYLNVLKVEYYDTEKKKYCNENEVQPEEFEDFEDIFNSEFTMLLTEKLEERFEKLFIDNDNCYGTTNGKRTIIAAKICELNFWH